MPGCRCSVALCNNSLQKTKGTGVIYHKFPKDALLRQRWLQCCKRFGSWNPDSCRVCSVHFSTDDYKRDLKAELLGLPQHKVLMENAVPHLNLGKDENPEKVLQSKRRAQRAQLRYDKRGVRQLLICPEEVQFLESPTQQDVEIQVGNSFESASDLVAENEMLRKEVNELRQKLKLIEDELAILKKKDVEEQNALTRQTFKKIFTPTQVRILLEERKKLFWKTEDMNFAFTLRCLGNKAYHYLRETIGIPLPSDSTLERWANKLKFKPGILDPVFIFLKTATQKLDPQDRLCVLQFDEMKVRYTYEYDRKNDCIVGPCNYVQVAQIRGLIGRWKQPIYFGFDAKMTAELLFEIIYRLHETGYRVVACVSDCAGGNRGHWKDLNLSPDHPFFICPNTNVKIFYFPDAPHLLKLIRNWLIDHGFIMPGGGCASKMPLKELVAITQASGEVRAVHKLGSEHLNCVIAQRQSVRLANQLLSHTVATALVRFCSHEDTAATAHFIRLTNAWFDLMNSYSPNKFWKNTIPHKAAYGLNLSEQNTLLDKYRTLVAGMRVCGRQTLETFQKAILMSISAIQGLYEDLSQEFPGIKYILTHRVKQDSLENLFSMIRSKGGFHDHPSPMEFICRLRMLCLGKGDGMIDIISNANQLRVCNDKFVSATVMRSISKECSSTSVLSDDDCCSDTLSLKSDSSSHQSTVIEPPAAQECCNDGVLYLAGWLADKHRKMDPSIGAPTAVHMTQASVCGLPSWIRQLSFGGLIEPSKEFHNAVIEMEGIFKKFSSLGFKQKKDIARRLMKKILLHVNVQEDIVKQFVRQRIYIKIKYLNHRIQENKLQKSQRKGVKKLKKTVT